MFSNSASVNGYTISAGNMIHGADYKAILMPDVIHISIIVACALITAIALKTTVSSPNKYAGVIMIAVMLAMAGLGVAVCILLGIWT